MTHKLGFFCKEYLFLRVFYFKESFLKFEFYLSLFFQQNSQNNSLNSKYSQTLSNLRTNTLTLLKWPLLLCLPPLNHTTCPFNQTTNIVATIHPCLLKQVNTHIVALAELKMIGPVPENLVGMDNNHVARLVGGASTRKTKRIGTNWVIGVAVTSVKSIGTVKNIHQKKDLISGGKYISIMLERRQQRYL